MKHSPISTKDETDSMRSVAIKSHTSFYKMEGREDAKTKEIIAESK